MLSKKNIFLRPIELEDSDLIRRWRFDEQSYDFFYEFVPISLYENNMWIESILKKKDEINFIVCEKTTKKNLGMISIIDIDYRNQKCEIGRVFVGAESRGKGIGRIALELCLEYSFKHLNMHKVYIEVFSENKGALNLYKKCGFIEDGYFQKHIYKNGIFKDIVHLSCFKDDYS